MGWFKRKRGDPAVDLRDAVMNPTPPIPDIQDGYLKDTSNMLESAIRHLCMDLQRRKDMIVVERLAKAGIYLRRGGVLDERIHFINVARIDPDQERWVYDDGTGNAIYLVTFTFIQEGLSNLGGTIKMSFQHD